MLEDHPQSQWTRPWTRLGSVRYLLLTDLDDMDKDSRDALRDAIAAVLNGADDKLLVACIPSGDARTDLVRHLWALKEITRRYEIDRSQKLYPIMWLRLFQIAAIPLAESALRSFARWQWSAFSKGQTWLMQYGNADGTWDGDRWKMPNTPKSILGLTLDQVLLREDSEWLRYVWRLVLRPAMAQSKPRPLIDEATRVAGSGAITVIKRCLKKAAKRHPNDFYDGANGLESNLSLDDVVLLLRNEFSPARNYAPSTIKRALPALVKCPRGRPPKRVAGL